VTEFDHLDVCFAKWEALPVSDRTRNQQIVVDVMCAFGAVCGDGFQHFWSEYQEEADRIIDSFRLAALGDLAVVLEKTRFLVDELRHCTDYDEVLRIVDAHEDTLHPLYMAFTSKEPDARESLLRFLPQQSG
jgi:hypothetical protein